MGGLRVLNPKFCDEFRDRDLLGAHSNLRSFCPKGYSLREFRVQSRRILSENIAQENFGHIVYVLLGFGVRNLGLSDFGAFM